MPIVGLSIRSASACERRRVLFFPVSHVSADVDPDFTFDPAQPLVIRVRGCVVGLIQEMSPVMTRSREEEGKILEEIMPSDDFDMDRVEPLIPLFVAEMNGLFRTVLGAKSHWDRADIELLAFTLVLGQYYDFFPPDEQTTADCSAFLLQCRSYDKDPSDLPSDECLAESGSSSGDGIRFFRRIYWFPRNRVMIRTEAGHIGLAPLFSEPGDTVAILYGCPNALVLRREGEFWRILGDAYLHSLIDVSTICSCGLRMHADDTLGKAH
jgi:hypothetical protein